MKGPSSVLYGRGAVGGAINLVRKKPQALKAFDVSYRGGRFNTHQLAAGATGAVAGNDRVLYRADASFESSDGWRRAGADRLNISPSLTVLLPGSSRLTSKSPRSLVWGFNTAEMPAVIAASCITCGVCAGKPCCRRIPLPADGCWRAQTKRPRERPFREAKRARVSRRQRAWVSPVARAFSVRRPGSVRSRACRRGSPRLPPRCCSSCWC